MGRTSIPCSSESRDGLSEFKDDEESWDELIQRLITLLEDAESAGEESPSEDCDCVTVDDLDQRLDRLYSDLLSEFPERMATELRQT